MRFGGGPRRKDVSPYRGITWAVVFGGGLLLIVLGYSYFATEPEAPKPSKPVQAAEPPPRHSSVSKEGEPKKKDLQPYLTDPAVLDDTVESKSLDTFPFYHLLYQATVADPAQLAAAAAPAPPPAEIAKWKPGTPVRLEGTVGLIRPRRDLAIPDAGIDTPMLHEVSDARGNLYLVLAAIEMKGVEEGDRVRVVGRYFRLHPYIPYEQATTGKEAPTPVIVTRAVDGSHLVQDASCLKTIKDKVLYREPKPFYYLVNMVRSLSRAELKKRADETLTAGRLLKSPSAGRGRFVGIEGALMLKETHEKPPNIAGVDHLHWCVLRTSGNEWLWVFTLEEPKGLGRREAVKAYGVFMKAQQYHSERGFERTALIVVARRLVRVEYKGSRHLAIVAVVIGLLTLAGVTAAVMVERRRSREFGEHVQKLSARTRPGDIDRAARAVASRTRQARAAVDAPADDESSGPRPVE